MQNETARQAYIRMLQKMAETIDSLPPKQRDANLYSELINDGCLEGQVYKNGSGVPIDAVMMGMKPRGRLFLQELEKAELDASLIQKHREAFRSLDRRGLSTMDDKSLAAWQSEFRQDEPEWIIAEHEWQRRLTTEQIEATMNAATAQVEATSHAANRQAWFGVAGAVIGALLILVGERLSQVPASGSMSNSVLSGSPPGTNIIATNLPAPPAKP
jgi:hypothetical protein